MSTVPIGNMNVGSIVRIPINNVAREFIVVQHGGPSTIYDVSFNNGTILLMRDLWESRQWHGSNVNDYQNSALHAWLNNQFLNMIAQNIRDQIKEVRVPFRPGSGTSMTVNSGAQGLPCRVFIPSFHEVGGGTHTNAPADGAVWSHFQGTLPVGNAEPRRVANLNGTAAVWWLRSPNTDGSAVAWTVRAGGDISAKGRDIPYHRRGRGSNDTALVRLRKHRPNPRMADYCKPTLAICNTGKCASLD